MKKINFLLAFLMLFSVFGFSQATDLIISEYGEGSSNNKYIEIYNGTGATVDLSQYKLWRISNGGSWPESEYTFTATTLADGDVITVANNSTDTPGADEYNSGFCSWNGDDAVGLAKDDGTGTFVLIDAIGTDGSDPGTGWDVAGVTDGTKDHYLVRKADICSPTTDWAISAGTDATDSQWIVNDLAGSPSSDFGSHTSNCSNSTTATLIWNGSTFNEASANDGSISNTITASLVNETFSASAGTQLTEGTDYTSANVPAGLTLGIVVINDTAVGIGFTGNATNNADADDVSNLTINFTNNAFSGGDASTVANSSKSDLVIDFIDGVVSKEMTWNDTLFTEALANNGSIANNITISLTGETFATVGQLVSGTDYVATNVPTGLTVDITSTSSTEAEISLTGNAANHTNADDINNLSIAFLDNAFSGGDASAVAYSTKTDLYVDFNDPYPTPDLVITEIMYNNPSYDTLEFIEIYNNESTDVNLDGFYMQGVTYTFGNIIMPAQSYLVLTIDSVNMQQIFGIAAYQWTSGGLSNSGEGIAIRNQGGALIDTVFYDDDSSWPDADGSGHSLVLCDYSADNNTPTAWHASENQNTNHPDIYASPMASDSACLPHPEMVWSETTFNESANNDGSIDNTITVSLIDETFATVGSLTENTDYTVANVPAGLTLNITTSDNATAVISLTGNATNNDNADDVNNLTVTFLDAAFTGGDASAVANSSIDTLKVDFNDTPIVPELIWNDTLFTEALVNNGSIANSITVTLTGETFATIDTLEENTDYTIANVPAGLNAIIEVTDSYNATISLTGNATNHTNADDINNLTIVFLDAAFTGGDASAVVNSSKQDIIIDFMDPYIIPNLVISEIMYNPPEGGTDSLEFVEIYNNDTLDVNLNNYYFNGVTYTFGNVTISQGERLVVCVDSMAMLNTFGINAYQWTSGGLSNGGEDVAIYNPGGELVDMVTYDDNADWPDADGSGHSLVLCDMNSDNNDFTNWTISTNYVTENTDNNKIWASPGQSDNVCTTSPSLNWDTTIFTESANDDGSIDNVINLTLSDDEFTTTGILTEGTDYTVANVPAGLQVVITTTSVNNAIVELTGNATNHTNADDVNNMQIIFNDNAFVSDFAANVANSEQDSIYVDFIGTTGINELNNTELSVYPNPTKGIVYILGKNITKVEFFDITGKQIPVDVKNNYYDLSNAHKGVYFVKIYSNNAVNVKQLVIE